MRELEITRVRNEIISKLIDKFADNLHNTSNRELKKAIKMLGNSEDFRKFSRLLTIEDVSKTRPLEPKPGIKTFKDLT